MAVFRTLLPAILDTWLLLPRRRQTRLRSPPICRFSVHIGPTDPSDRDLLRVLNSCGAAWACTTRYECI